MSGQSGPRAVVLLSGGMDSATTAAIALEQGYDVHALSFRYGQRHAVELDSARRVAERLGSYNKGPGRMPEPFHEMPVDIWGQTREEWRARKR